MSLPPYLQSRIHPLADFCHNEANVYLKRDDELSCGISGTKKRKYASIIPNLLKQKIEHVYIIGSAHSNNVLSALQCLKENHFSVTVLLLKPNNEPDKGNFKLSKLFLNENEIVWIERSDWPRVNKFAHELATQHPKNSFILFEGGSVKEGIDGAKTLGSDIIRNEQEHNLTFDHIFIDSGTGFSANCCIKVLEESKHTANIHVIHLAGNTESFKSMNAALIHATLEKVSFYYPSNARSFGSINSSVKDYLRQFAHQYGVLLDPIYSAKCLYESQKIIEKKKLTGNILITHSGGVLSLPNFAI